MLHFAPLLALALLAIPFAGLAQEEEEEKPLGPVLLTARTIFILNTVMDFSLSSAFTNELLDWERFELVFSEDDADLCFSLSADDDYRQLEIPTGDDDDGLGRRAMGTMRVLDTLYFKVFVPGGDEQWKDEADVGEDSSAARLLITRLRERLEEEERRVSADEEATD